MEASGLYFLYQYCCFLIRKYTFWYNTGGIQVWLFQSSSRLIWDRQLNWLNDHHRSNVKPMTIDQIHERISIVLSYFFFLRPFLSIKIGAPLNSCNCYCKISLITVLFWTLYSRKSAQLEILLVVMHDFSKDLRSFVSLLYYLLSKQNKYAIILFIKNSSNPKAIWWIKGP